MKIPKQKRIVDRKLLDSYQGKTCAICFNSYGTVAHHIKSKGSGGDDIRENLICLCMKHHSEIHQIGMKTFFNKYWGDSWIMILNSLGCVLGE